MMLANRAIFLIALIPFSLQACTNEDSCPHSYNRIKLPQLESYKDPHSQKLTPEVLRKIVNCYDQDPYISKLHTIEFEEVRGNPNGNRIAIFGIFGVSDVSVAFEIASNDHIVRKYLVYYN